MAEQTDSVHHCVGERQWNQIMQITPTAYFLQEFVYHLTFNTNLPFWQFFFFFAPRPQPPQWDMGGIVHDFLCGWRQKKKKNTHTHTMCQPLRRWATWASMSQSCVCVCSVTTCMWSQHPHMVTMFRASRETMQPIVKLSNNYHLLPEGNILIRPHLCWKNTVGSFQMPGRLPTQGSRGAPWSLSKPIRKYTSW